MEWFTNRHAFYIHSADFMSILTLLHLCCMIFCGYGLRRHSLHTADLRNNIWSLTLASSLFIICLGFANCPKEKPGSTRPSYMDNVYKWLLPFIVSASLVTFITLSIYHGTIFVLALALLLLAFVLTGIPCGILLIVCIASVAVGMSCYVMLLAYNFSERHRLPKSLIRQGISISLRHGALKNRKIILMDMALLGTQILGGPILYSRLTKIGHLLSQWKQHPARFLGNFDALRELEASTLQKCLEAAGTMTFASLTSTNTLTTRLTQPTHQAPPPELDSQCSLASATNSIGVIYEDAEILGENANDDVDDDDDPVWLEFCNTYMSSPSPSRGGELFRGTIGGAQGPITITKDFQEGGDQDGNAGGDGVGVAKVTRVQGIRYGKTRPRFSREAISPCKISGASAGILGGASMLGPQSSAPESLGLFLDNMQASRSRIRIDSLSFDGVGAGVAGTSTGFENIFTSGRLSAAGTVANSRMPSNLVPSTSHLLAPLGSGATMAQGGLGTAAADGGDFCLSIAQVSSFDHMRQATHRQDRLSVPRRGGLSTLTSRQSTGRRSGSEYTRATVFYASSANTVSQQPNLPMNRFFESASRVTKGSVITSIQSDEFSVALKPEGEAIGHLNTANMGPYAAAIYHMLPESWRGCCFTLFRGCCGNQEWRNIITRSVWSKAPVMPRINTMGLFSNSKVEAWYVDWMHEFNIKFHTTTRGQCVAFCLYATIIKAVATYRHFMILEPAMAKEFITKRRIAILTCKFVLVPIVAIVLITMLPIKTSGCRGKTPTSPQTQAQLIYKVMLLVCLLHWFVSLVDVYSFPVQVYPGFVMQGPLSVFILMAATGIYMSTRVPTLLALYLLYFISNVAVQIALVRVGVRYIIMDIMSQLVLGICTITMVAVPLDANRRRLFSSYMLPYLFYLERIKIFSRKRSRVVGKENVRLHANGAPDSTPIETTPRGN